MYQVGYPHGFAGRTRCQVNYPHQLADISPLKELEELERINLYNNPIPEEQIEELKQALPNCKILF
jgi:Leucine-rich repeat (LRR) protein